MTDVGRHPGIRLYTLSEVVEIRGSVGNFDVKILKKARYVNERECTACGECAKVCPVVRPDEFNLGLSSRKAIYSPFPQAVPSAYVLNINECLGQNPVVCAKCIEACNKKCINFHMSDEEIWERVGTIIVATGMEPYDPRELDEYGYTHFENVVTSLELERLISAGGPTGGRLIRPTDRRPPRSIGFVQCVGSRSVRKGGRYCSNVCCMNTIKQAIVIKEHNPEMETKVFYIDIRAFGKGFEELYLRSRRMGVKFIRGLPGNVEEGPERCLRVAVENVATGAVEVHDLDMLVLAIGMKPPEENQRLQEMLGLQRTPDGFFLEAHPKLQPVDAASKGIFFAGCAEGPKDIKESVTQGSASALRAIRLMHRGEIHTEPINAEVIADLCRICGICARVCPYRAITVDVKKKAPAIVNTAACAGCGTCAAECPSSAIIMNHFTDRQIMDQIDAILEENPEEKVVAFACNWCSYAGADYAGVSRLQYPTTVRIIRTMCSGRVSEGFIWHAFKRGAPVVLVSGCHLGDCHYINANQWTEKRITRVHKKMAELNIRKDRLQLAWISSAEGTRFAELMHRLEILRKEVTAEEIAHTIKILEGLKSTSNHQTPPKG